MTTHNCCDTEHDDTEPSLSVFIAAQIGAHHSANNPDTSKTCARIRESLTRNLGTTAGKSARITIVRPSTIGRTVSVSVRIGDTIEHGTRKTIR